MVKKILVAVDGSETSYVALKYALNMGKVYNAKVTVFHAAIPLDYSQLPKYKEACHKVTQLPPEGKDVYSIDRTLSPLACAKKKAARMGYSRVTFKEIIATSVVQAILDEAKTDKIDTIVLGNRGIGGIKGILMGSIAYRIVEYANCNVVIVK